MSNPIPNQLALISIADDAEIVASDHRNNYAAVQSAVNELIVAWGVTAKGDLVVATASGQVQVVSVGADGQVLTADSSQTAGVKWAAVSSAGTQLDYAQITANVSQTANAYTAAITGNAVVYDGSRVKVEFAASAAVLNSAGSDIALYRDGAILTSLFKPGEFYGNGGAISAGPYAQFFDTPAAGAHTYAIYLKSDGVNTQTIYAGAGGSGVSAPAFLRVTKA